MHTHRHYKKRTVKQLFPITVVVISILMMLFFTTVASAASTHSVESPETAVSTDSPQMKTNSSEDSPDLVTQKDISLSTSNMWLGTAVLLLLFAVTGYALLEHSTE